VIRSESPFLVGIDLGTTNSAVAFVDTRRGGRVQMFRVPQLTAPGLVEPYPVLPSFLFFPDAHELESGALSTPWAPRPDAIVGVLARERGAAAPARHVASAKSWLAHPAVDRRAAILPWGETPGPKISPVDASARYLSHIRDSWNTAVASSDTACRLERQTIVLTVPASFDEAARELTLRAASDAGLTRVTLLEEPQAAFYAWIERHPDWRDNIIRERVNSALRWGREPVSLSLRKAVKGILALKPFCEALFLIASTLERLAPDCQALDRIYQVLLGVHIRRGYREGARQYDRGASESQLLTAQPRQT